MLRRGSNGGRALMIQTDRRQTPRNDRCKGIITDKVTWLEVFSVEVVDFWLVFLC